MIKLEKTLDVALPPCAAVAVEFIPKPAERVKL
jgi:hypothetical protein